MEYPFTNSLLSVLFLEQTTKGVALSESDQFKRKKKERKKVLHFLKFCHKGTKGHESLKSEQKFILKVSRIGQVDQFLNNSFGGTSFDLHHKKQSENWE